MGRKAAPGAIAIAATAALDATPTTIAEQINQSREHQDRVIAKWGDGIPYIREAYVAEIRRDMARTVEAALAIGRRLIVMREIEPRGGWLDCLAQTGLAEDTAQRMMAAARRIDALPNTATSRYLTDAVGNQSKLFELLTLDSDQFSALAAGDEVAGITLDDVEQMTVKELRAALRESREDIAAKNERLQKKEEAIERKEKTIRALKKERDKATPEETTALLRDACTRAALTVRSDITATGEVASLRTTFEELFQHDSSPASRHFLAGLIGEAMVALRGLRDEYGLPVINDDAQA